MVRVLMVVMMTLVVELVMVLAMVMAIVTSCTITGTQSEDPAPATVPLCALMSA